MFTTPTSTPKRAGIGHTPPEILSEIFVHCLPTDSASQDTQKLLSSVCRRWRALVLATPALWASLNITYNIDVLRPPLPVIRTHLQRSGTHPLSITLRSAEYSESDTDHPYILAALTALAAARRRWHDVHIELYRLTQDILNLIMMSDAPMLQDIRCEFVESQWLIIPLHMLHRCPRLELLRWRSSESPLFLPPGDTKLTSLSLHTFTSISDCITLLRLSPRLFDARFHFITPDPSPPNLVHPALCSLTITGRCPPAFLAALTGPSLWDLNLTIEDTEWDTALSAFLIRSKPPLRQLSLFLDVMSDLEPAIMRVLALTPRLLNLTLSRRHPFIPPFTAALIRGLHPPPPPAIPLCSRLQRLNISGISDCPDGLCGAMLWARWGAQAHANGVACVELVDIGFNGGVHDHDQADMAELRAEGMQGVFRLEG